MFAGWRLVKQEIAAGESGVLAAARMETPLRAWFVRRVWGAPRLPPSASLGLRQDGAGSRGWLCAYILVGLAMFGCVWQAGGMKKQLADQSFHDRRYQERKRAEAARKPVQKKAAAGERMKQGVESRVPGSE